MEDRLTVAMRQRQAWRAHYRSRARVLVPTDLAELVFAGIWRKTPDMLPPAGTGLTLCLRQEPVDQDRQVRLPCCSDELR